MTSIVAFLEGLIATSEKAAQISKIIRLAYLAPDGSNSIATEQKYADLRSDETDFKTLADVLCQSVIDSDIRKLVSAFTLHLIGLLLTKSGSIPKLKIE